MRGRASYQGSYSDPGSSPHHSNISQRPLSSPPFRHPGIVVWPPLQAPWLGRQPSRPSNYPRAYPYHRPHPVSYPPPQMGYSRPRLAVHHPPARLGNCEDLLEKIRERDHELEFKKRNFHAKEIERRGLQEKLDAMKQSKESKEQSLNVIKKQNEELRRKLAEENRLVETLKKKEQLLSNKFLQAKQEYVEICGQLLTLKARDDSALKSWQSYKQVSDSISVIRSSESIHSFNSLQLSSSCGTNPNVPILVHRLY